MPSPRIAGQGTMTGPQSGTVATTTRGKTRTRNRNRARNRQQWAEGGRRGFGNGGIIDPNIVQHSGMLLESLLQTGVVKLASGIQPDNAAYATALACQTAGFVLQP